MLTWQTIRGALFVALLSGCQVLAGPRPVVVLTCDAETKKPIKGAEVRTLYPGTMTIFSPRNSYYKTKADGIAKLKVAPVDDLGVVLTASAPGYLDAEKNLSTEAVRADDSAGLFGLGHKKAMNVVLEMYAQPYPAAELVIPAGFHGMIEAKVVEGKAPWGVGERIVRFAVPASGKVEVCGPAWLPHDQAPELRVSCANGTPISARAEHSELGYWWVKSKGAVNFVLVGTKHDYEDYRLFTHPDHDDSSPHSGGSAGGGRGRRGRRGGQQPGDID